MGHPDKGDLLALLDGEIHGPGAREIQAHLERCPDCRAGLQALEVATKATAEALVLIDDEPHPGRVRDRLTIQAEPATRAAKRPGSSPTWLPWSLPKAASIALLLTGAVATALPGSPVRRWLVQGWEALAGSGGQTFTQEDQRSGIQDSGSDTQSGFVPETGVGITALSQGVEIAIRDLSSSAALRVVWTDGTEAWVFAGEGTRFNRDEGLLEALSPPGDIRLEIPRTLQRVVVRLDGSVLLRKVGDEVEILGPVQERTPSEILFEKREPTNDGGT